MCEAFVKSTIEGKINTRSLYKLSMKDGVNIYSNEVLASINKNQLTINQEYTPGGLMDPYVD